MMHGSREVKSKFYGSWELNQNFHELHKIQRLILFVVHIILQNWGIDYHWFLALEYQIYNSSQLHALLSVYSTQAELVTLPYLQSFSVEHMCKNNIVASTFIGIKRQWHRLYNTLFFLWGLHVLPSALQMPACKDQCFLDKGIRTRSLLPTNAFIAFEDVVGST